MKKLHSCNYERRKSRYYYCTSFALVPCSFTKKIIVLNKDYILLHILVYLGFRYMLGFTFAFF